ncbi:MAG: APC family permease [Peptostreptococcaceae bacterium]
MSKQTNLKKSIGLFAALSTVVGIVIGSGIFFKANAVFAATGAPGLGIIAWALAGIITIAAGLTSAELAAAIPETGGMVVYLKRIYGDKIGFLTGWMLSILYYPGLMAALGFIFASNFASLLGLDASAVPVIGVGVILLLAFANCIGSKAGGMIQTVSTLCKLVPLFLIMVLGFVKGDGSVSTSLYPITNPEVNLSTGLGVALLGTLFAYEGWLSAGNLAGEMKNPKKDLPKAIVIGITAVTLIYIAINMAYLWVLPADVLASSETPATDVANVIFGPTGARFITAGIAISIFGTLNAIILTGPRTLYALALEHNIPFVSKVNKGEAPGNAILVMSIVGALYSLTQNFGLLTDVPVFVVWIFYILTFIGVIILRNREPKLERPYRVPLYPIVPLVAIIGGGYVVVSTLMTQTQNALLGLAIALVGLPIYFVISKSKNSDKKQYNKAV